MIFFPTCFSIGKQRHSPSIYICSKMATCRCAVYICATPRVILFGYTKRSHKSKLFIYNSPLHRSVKMRWKFPKPFFYASVAATTAAVAYLTKDYMGGTKYTGKESLVNKVVIVTGANTGIGRETVLELAKRDAKIIMACRDMEKCEKARQDIVLETKNKYVYCRKCDLASQESIRKFVEQFKNEYDKLHILINNAGVMRCSKSYTKEGIEMQLGVNYIGHFLLTNLLLDVLKTSAPSRIVNVSSASYYRGQINMTDLNSDKEYDAGNAYTQSKLAIIFFTRELANKLRGTGVTVNAIHPGVVDTNITRHMFVYNNFFTRIFLKPFAWPFIRAPLQGAQTVLYAALDPSLTDVSGCYFDNCEIKEVSDGAKNDNLSKWLWKVSEKWTKLDMQLRWIEAKTLAAQAQKNNAVANQLFALTEKC